LWKSLDDILEVLDGGGNCEKTDVSGSLCNCFERLFVFVQEQVIVLFDGVFSVQNLCEVEWYPNKYVSRGSCISSNVFEEKFGFREVEALRINQLQIWIRKHLAFAHFEEAIEDEDEFWEIGRKISANDIFLTLATDFLTEVPAREHLLQNCSLPNCKAPVWRSL
jgi:hypothetical protein